MSYFDAQKQYGDAIASLRTVEQQRDRLIAELRNLVDRDFTYDLHVCAGIRYDDIKSARALLAEIEAAK